MPVEMTLEAFTKRGLFSYMRDDSSNTGRFTFHPSANDVFCLSSRARYAKSDVHCPAHFDFHDNLGGQLELFAGIECFSD